MTLRARPTGEERWRFAADGPVNSSPVIAGATVYFGQRVPLAVAGIAPVLPLSWLVAMLAGASPFLAYPWWLTGLVVLFEAVLAAWLVGPWSRE